MLSALFFYAFLFLTLVVVPAGLILVVLLVLEHKRRLWQRVTPAIEYLGAMMAQWPVIINLRKRFPRTARFLVRRINPYDPWGLPGTVASIGILVGLWFFLGVLQDIVAKDPLVILNIRLHNTVPLFRSTGMTWFMLAVTQLGSGTVLSLLCLGMVALTLAHHQRRTAATFMLALAGTGLLSATLKALFGYARPIDLGVHWPSDLLGSLALALMVLASLFFFLHYDRPIDWIDTFEIPFGTRTLRIAGSVVLLTVLGAAAVLTIQTQMVPIGPPPALHSINIQALRISLPPDLPLGSEDLIGGQMEPISLVFVGSEEDLVGVFMRAGWVRADLPTPLRVVQEGLAALRNQPDPAGPATPAYFANRPQNLTFEKPETGAASIRKRHHTRLWQTSYCVAPKCRPLWVATASFDMGIELSQRLHLPTHRIDAAIDIERALIVTDLIGVGATQEGNVTVSQTLHGMNAAGDPFSTDGHAVVLVLP